MCINNVSKSPFIEGHQSIRNAFGTYILKYCNRVINPVPTTSYA